MDIHEAARDALAREADDQAEAWLASLAKARRMLREAAADLPPKLAKRLTDAAKMLPDHHRPYDFLHAQECWCADRIAEEGRGWPAGVHVVDILAAQAAFAAAAAEIG